MTILPKHSPGRRVRIPSNCRLMPVDRTTQGTLHVATVTAVWLGIVAVAALDRAPWEEPSGVWALPGRPAAR